MPEQKTINVEVAYASPDRQVIVPLQVKPGTTLLDAIKLAGILEQFPEIDLAQAKFGIFSKISPAETILREKDRVEIYRELIADPKDSRRKRAEKKHGHDKAADDNA
jgi:putative ubiquitin-RnfH superfamily antitoxin RatB of RatAB toxin-antitoxin module